MTFDLDLDQVQPVVRRWDASLTARAVSRLHGGSTEVYRIDLEGSPEPLVLKLYPDKPWWAAEKEELIALWLDEVGGFPIPNWRTMDKSRAILPLRWALISWLPGRTVRDLIDEPDIETLYHQMGQMLRRLHGIPGHWYGYIFVDGVFEPTAANADYMIPTFARSFKWARDNGAETDLVRRLEAAAERRFDLLNQSAGPVFCHDDFQPGNLLAQRDATGVLRLTGLIDFANARCGDALFDLAKTLMCSSHEDPRSAPALLEGYGPIDHRDAEGALWLYTLFHRITMWAFLVGLGDDPASAGPAGLMRDLTEMVR